MYVCEFLFKYNYKMVTVFGAGGFKIVIVKTKHLVQQLSI